AARRSGGSRILATGCGGHRGARLERARLRQPLGRPGASRETARGHPADWTRAVITWNEPASARAREEVARSGVLLHGGFDSGSGFAQVGERHGRMDLD